MGECQDAVATPEPAKLTKKGEDFQVQMSLERQAASHKEDCWSWSCLMESKESLDVDLVLLV